MSTTLEQKLNTIANEKINKIIPENIKKGVTIFNIEGTYEGSGGGTVEGIKQFSTVEEMNNSTGNEEGDLAVVYKSEVQNATVDSQFQVATFPDTVVLDSAFTDFIEVRYRPVDDSVMFDCWGQLDSSTFMMDCHTESGSVRIQYESSDGITYTRTDTAGNPVDFGTEIYYEIAEMWNDAIGKFIQVSNTNFGGLYEYSTKTNTDYAVFGRNYHFEGTDSSTLLFESTNIYIKDLREYIINTILPSVDFSIGNFVVVKNNDTVYSLYTDNSQYVSSEDCINAGIRSNYDTDGTSYIVKYNNNSNVTHTMHKFVVDTTTWTYTHTTQSIGQYGNGDNITNLWTTSINVKENISSNVNIYLHSSSSQASGNYIGYTFNNAKVQLWYSAPTQLTATPDYVYEKEFYGKNGVETGTLGTPDNSFIDTNAELVYKIQNAYNNMEPRVLTNSDKTIDDNIYFIPVKLDGTPLLDTSSVTDMGSVFYWCKNLINIPLLDTSSATNMYSTFQNCKNLITIPLLNTSKVTTMGFMFSSCTKLITIPLIDTSKVNNMEYMFYGCTNLTEIPLLNTSNVTNMYYMFKGCTNLITIPQLNTNKVTNMLSMFNGCTSLSDESLNNILAMCATSSYTGTKTLNHIGLTSAQANKCKTLSNYQAFLNAGWTTGY